MKIERKNYNNINNIDINKDENDIYKEWNKLCTLYLHVFDI